ncbi:MAG: hypothetical protein GEU95_02505 [Rhizobiales bacterium]|nr:hypothetical protein [Hyphomicrobiales bacterium]
MASRRKAAAAGEDASSPAPEKIARLLALLVTRDMETDDAALKLDGVGFSAREISDLLGVGANYVNVAKHRKKGRKTSKPHKKADG